MNIHCIHTTFGETTAPYNYIQDIIIEESGASKEEKQPKMLASLTFQRLGKTSKLVIQFLVCKDFVLGLAAVRTPDGLWNFLQTDGTLLLNHGVDWCTDFDRATGLAKISTYRGENYINTDGDLLKPWPALKQKKRLPRGTRVLAA